MKLKSIPVFLFILSLVAGPAFAGPTAPTKKDRCPVCGMFVAPYTEWVATISFQDGSNLFFDGCKDLFRYYFDLPEKGDGLSRNQIESIWFTEYYSTRKMKAAEVFFVIGSDVMGPMGKELIPIAGEKAVKIFMRDHKGTEALTFDQIKPAKLPAE